jgi:hypothetical protein
MGNLTDFKQIQMTMKNTDQIKFTNLWSSFAVIAFVLAILARDYQKNLPCILFILSGVILIIAAKKASIIEGKFKVKEFTDEQVANYPSYGWPLVCAHCGSGMGSNVKAYDCNKITFQCQLCGHFNKVKREGNRVTIISGPKVSVLKIIIASIIIGELIKFLIHHLSA